MWLKTLINKLRPGVQDKVVFDKNREKLPPETLVDLPRLGLSTDVSRSQEADARLAEQDRNLGGGVQHFEGGKLIVSHKSGGEKKG